MIFNRKAIIRSFLLIIAFILLIFGTTYAFFNYTRTGAMNNLSVGTVKFSHTTDTLIDVSNDFPQDIDMNNEELVTMKSSHDGVLSITAHNTLTDGVRYRIYVLHDDAIPNKQRLADSSIKFQLEPDFTSGTNGFTVLTNYYENPTNLSFDNEGKALISTGLVKNTSQLTTVDYNFYMWIDASTTHISSTMKRATLAEGNPSLADTSSGNTTAARYMKNDGTLTTVTLFPASQEQSGKIIYTTNEFSNGYYNIKFLVEAEAADGDSIVYLDANGGTVNNSVITVTPGENYPVLPTPTRDGYTFLGWNGKNKAIFSPAILAADRVQNGITWHATSENTVHISDTASGNSFLTVGLNAGSSDLRRLTAGTYTVSSNLTKTTTDNVYIYGFYEGDTSSRSFANGISNNVNRTFTLTSDADINIQMVIAAGTSIDQEVWVQIEEGTTATTYEPYFIDDTVTVTQPGDHSLTAIWQKNS